MADEPRIGYGSLFKVGDAASPELFTTVAGLFGITPGPMSTAVVDVTKHESANAHREKIAGLKDTGPFTIAGEFRPSNATQSKAGTRGLLKLWDARTTFNFEIVVADGNSTTWGPVAGFVSGFKPGEISVDGKMQFTAEITPTTQGTLP